MDTTVTDTTVTTLPSSRLSWSAIFGGALFAVATWLLLHLLGLGIGLSAVDPQNPNTLRGVGIGTGVWSAITPLIALFVGGLVAARVAGSGDRVVGAIHGAVIWALTTLVGVFLLLRIVGALVGTVAQVGGAAVGAVGGAAAQAVQGLDLGSLQALGIDSNDLVVPINQRLQQQGMPPVTAQQLEEAARDALQTSVREGRFDRDVMTSSLADRTRLSHEEAEQVAIIIETRFDAAVADARATAQQAARSAEHGALQVADTTGKAMLGVFFALLLSLLSAVLGATIGATRVRRRIERFERAESARTVVTTQPATAEPIP